jgi:hypothetical protein
MHMRDKTNDVYVDKWSVYDIRGVKLYIGKKVFMGYHQVLSSYHLMIGVEKINDRSQNEQKVLI